ncbi:alanine racemase [candidate division KSB3 bacterium]|nr:MAG: alanine racemase [candidate division KSB3 bacterium]
MNHYRRPAWIEIDLKQLERNFRLIQQDKPPQLRVLAVVKDQAYGHGAYECATIALKQGASMLGVVTLSEAVELREKGITAPILLLGERLDDQLELCLHYDLTLCINRLQQAQRYARYAQRFQKRPKIHIEIDTGLSRYGIRWTEAAQLAEQICHVQALECEGIMSHFAKSDELDKSYAEEQLARFRGVLDALDERGIAFPLKHLCNSGGFLDLPQAHFDMIRSGILPLGVYPSQRCRRIAGIKPIMSVKAKIIAIQQIQAGDSVGYSMHYTARGPRRIGVIAVGYGDGFPRVRNQGHVLVHGQRAPIVGGNAMDAVMVDVSEIPQSQIGDDVVIMGKQGQECISVHELAALKASVSYDILTNWSPRLPRVYI